MRVFLFQILLFFLPGFFQGTLHAREKLGQLPQGTQKSTDDSIFLKNLNDSAWRLRNSNPEIALFLLDSIISLSKEKKQYHSLVTAYNNIGIIYANARDYTNGLKWIIKAYNIAFEIKDTSGMGRSLNNLAVLSKNNKQYDNAIDYITNAIEMHQKNRQLKMMGISYINFGNIYKSQKNYSKALDCFRMSMQYADSVSDRITGLSASMSVSEVLLLSGKHNEALTELDKISAQCRIYKNDVNSWFYNRLMGDYYSAVKNFGLAKISYDKAFAYARASKDITLQTETLEKLIEVSRQMNDYHSAFNFQVHYSQLSDSINNVRSYILVSKIEFEEEYAEKKKDENRQNQIKEKNRLAEINYQRRVSVILGVSLMFLIAFGIIGFINYRQKIRDSKILQSQRREIILKNEALKLQMEQDKEKSEIISFINHENEILSLVAKETDNSVFIIEADGTIEWVNEAFQRLSGYTLSEFKRIRGSRIQEASSSESIVETFNYCLKEKVPVTYISQTTTKDQKLIWIHTTLTPILNEQGEISKLIAIDTDITKIKEVEQDLEQKNKEITSSLEYASRIQHALLPLASEMEAIFKDYFIINLPQSIVSGDFYWVTKKNGQYLAVVADSTGHGVPGAFMSLLGISALQEIVYKLDDLNPALILELLRRQIIGLLHYKNSGLSASESWDIAVCVVDEQSLILRYAGSNNSVLLIHNEDLIELKPDKFFIWDEVTSRKAFTQQSIQLNSSDRVYLFTDGFSDQFGGSEDKKFSRRKLKKMLTEIYTLPMDSQKELLNMVFKDWKGHNEQVDDIMVMGFQV